VRVLVLSGMLPSRATPHAGVFIERRVKALRLVGVTVDVLAVQQLRTGLAGFALRAVGKGPDPLTRHGSDARRVKVTMSSPTYLAMRFGHRPKPAVESAARAISDQVDLAGYDLVHAHGMYGFPMGAVAASMRRAGGPPYVVTLHGSDVYFTLPKISEMAFTTLSGASAVICVSDALRQRASSFGSGCNSVVIPNGVDTNVFRPLDRRQTRAKLNFPEDATVVAYVGALTHTKGADRLPAVFHRLARTAPGMRFVVVGAGPLLKSIQRGVAGLNVVFAGNIDEIGVVNVMNASDLLVVPSRSEGWPNVILEAYACGTPVVGCDVGGVAEAIRDADFVISGEPEELISRLSDAILANLRQPRPTSTLTQRAGAYTWLVLAEQEAAVYASVLRHGRL
jgi:teichuronic acid biosynthesis glycosyltransferase TuaC